MWVVITLVSLAVLVIFVLCVPLGMVLRMDVYNRPKFRMRLVWLFGLVSKEVSREKKKPEEKAAEGKPKPRRRRIGAKTVLQLLRTKGLLEQFKRLLKDILGCFKIRDFVANFRVGLDDPADTGLLFAVIGPATFFLNSSFPHRIRVQPSFEDEMVFEGSLSGVLRLWPIQLVLPVLKFVFSLATIRLLKTLVVSRWKGKKK